MRNNYKIAITTTVYNDVKFIKRLLLSLLEQTTPCFKHYILEDGSTESSEDVIYWYKNEIENRKLNIDVVYIKNDINIGVNKGHELLFRMIEEEYFCWIDADDWVRNNFITIVTSYINKYREIDVFHVNSSQYNMEYKQVVASTIATIPKNIVNSDDQFPAYCLTGESFHHNFIIKTDSFKKINPGVTIFENNEIRRMWYDAQILFEMCLCHSKFKMIKEPISCILLRPYSLSRSPRDPIAFSDNKINCRDIIITSLPFSKVDVSIYRTLYDYSLKYYSILSKENILTNVNEALSFFKEYKRIIKKLKFPSNYLNLYTHIPGSLISAKHPVYYKTRRFIINIKQWTCLFIKKISAIKAKCW